MAINFPSTAGQSTNGSYTFTVSGITYSWDGQSWNALGANITSTLGSSDPVGTIVAWGGSTSTIPNEYQLCDGGTAATSALQAITGANVPDLRSRFIVGANDVTGEGTWPSVGVGSTGGQADAIVPNHTHPTSVDSGRLFHQGGQSNTVTYGGAGSYPGTVFSMSNPSSGESVTNKNLPPYYALCYIIKHTTTSGSGGGTSDVAKITAISAFLI